MCGHWSAPKGSSLHPLRTYWGRGARWGSCQCTKREGGKSWYFTWDSQSRPVVLVHHDGGCLDGQLLEIAIVLKFDDDVTIRCRGWRPRAPGASTSKHGRRRQAFLPADETHNNSLFWLLHGELSPPPHQTLGSGVNHPEERVVRCRGRVQLSNVPVRDQEAPEAAQRKRGRGGKGGGHRVCRSWTPRGRYKSEKNTNVSLN